VLTVYTTATTDWALSPAQLASPARHASHIRKLQFESEMEPSPRLDRPTSKHDAEYHPNTQRPDRSPPITPPGRGSHRRHKRDRSCMHIATNIRLPMYSSCTTGASNSYMHLAPHKAYIPHRGTHTALNQQFPMHMQFCQARCLCSNKSVVPAHIPFLTLFQINWHPLPDTQHFL
jgi:hypothetical protein